METTGKTIVLIGLALTALCLLVWWPGPKFGASGGLLPGDLSVRRGAVSFHFPIVTCIVLSVLVTLLLRLFNR